MIRRAALALTILSGGLAPALAADAPKLPGHWQLVIIDLSETPLFAFEAKAEGTGLAATISDPGNMGPNLKLGKAAASPAGLALDFSLGGTDAKYTTASAPEADSLLGTMTFRGRVYPVRLEKIDGEKIVPLREERTLSTMYMAAMRDREPAGKLAKLKAIVGEGGPTSPKTGMVDEALHKALVATKAPEAEVKAHADRWVAAAKPYGEPLTVQVLGQVYEGLKGKAGYEAMAKETGATYGPIAFSAAVAADKALAAEATAELKVAAASKLLAAARIVGNSEIVATTEARIAKLDAVLDAEYHAKVPPFKPAPAAARKSGSTQVALMELFTGAQCPPCVAADVGFDALISSYKPTELITLQYHLHIPGPDPLTNGDSEDRQKYYGSEIGGTPSTFFNGKSAAGGGGGMGGSEGKFNEYRKLIDPLTEGKATAKVDLSAKLDGDTIKVSAVAEAKTGEKSKPYLRLALIEEQVKYVGGNGLRYHHHVVRKFIGGAAGKALADGTVKVEETLTLADVRKFQNASIAEFEAKSAFPNPLPPIELKGLSVVAFVQDDADKSILQAAQVELDKPAASKAHP